MQCRYFTSGADLWILDRFKVLDVCEPENTAHHLRASKADSIPKDPRHGGQPISLERLRSSWFGEKLGYKCITGYGFAPEREKFRFEPNPDRLNGVEQPAAVCGNRVRLATVAVLRNVTEHQIREDRTDVKAHGA